MNEFYRALSKVVLRLKYMQELAITWPPSPQNHTTPM